MTTEAKVAEGPQRGRALLVIDHISTFVGKMFAWSIIGLMLVVCIEVFKRYALGAPTSWIFDLNNMFYGTLFMMCGAYTLAQNAHVRGDFLYSSFQPRTQAGLDLALYLLFFIPGILALCYAGFDYARDSWRILERSNISSDGPPVYHFKTVIPIAGGLLLLQGLAEIARCVICLRDGQWPPRLSDVSEIDGVGDQLANSAYVDADAKKAAIENTAKIQEAARQRDRGGDPTP